MYRILHADKDSYITNKIVNSTPVVSSNVGRAASLDLFKLYGVTKTNNVPNLEISRLLVHFDLSDLKSEINAGNIDINDQSFWCKISLKDVYGGQTTPSNFTVNIHPLSSSFSEGLGKDVVYFTDLDSCNWISSSFEVPWSISGCSSATTSSTPGDYITGSVLVPSTLVTQYFKEGTEDLFVDVTQIISATIAGDIPDEGFRLSFSDNIEQDHGSYFVKRFGSRHAYNPEKRPSLVFGFDDSVSDDSQYLTFDTTNKVNLYNYVQGDLKNIQSSSVDLTGSNCLTYVLSTEYPAPSGSYLYSLAFSGSQLTKGSNSLTGTYQSTFQVSSTDPVISAKIAQSGSVNFYSYWLSGDQTVVFSTGSIVTISPPSRTSQTNKNLLYKVNTIGTKDSYSNDEIPTFRVNIWDYNNPLVKLARLPVELPGMVLKNVFYSIRDAVTNESVIPFDDIKNSTKVSSDSSGMFFRLHTSSLISGRTYSVDIMISINGNKIIFPSSSANFRIV